MYSSSVNSFLPAPSHSSKWQNNLTVQELTVLYFWKKEIKIKNAKDQKSSEDQRLEYNALNKHYATFTYNVFDFNKKKQN